MDWTPSQSKDRLDDTSRTEPREGCCDTVKMPRSVNARFIAYLEQVYAPRTPWRLSVLTAGIIAGACFLALAVFAFVREVHVVWPLFPLCVALIVHKALSIHHRLGTRHCLYRVRDVIEKGTPVTGYLVQTPPALLRPGTDNLPCLVLFSFQPEVGNDADYMKHLATRLHGCKNRTPRNSAERHLASLTSDDKFVLYRRRPLPFSFTDGSAIYCADVWVSRAYIRHGYLKGESLPLLAEAGESGGVELIPWWLIAPEADPLAPPASTLSNTPASC